MSIYLVGIRLQHGYKKGELMENLNIKVKKWITGALLLLTSQIGYAADPVALVLDVRGSAAVIQPHKAKLAILSYLAPGTVLRIEPGAKVAVTYFYKALEYNFTGPAVVAIKPEMAQVISGNPAQRRDLEEMQTEAVKKLALRPSDKLARATFEMRSLPKTLRLLAPLNSAIVTTTPELSWESVPGAQHYRLVIADARGLTLVDEKTSASSWRVPKDAPLPIGQTYRWRVEAQFATGKVISPDGEFWIVDQLQADKIARIRPPANASFADRVLYAVTLENLDLKEDAKTEWSRLAQERPQEILLQQRAAQGNP